MKILRWVPDDALHWAHTTSDSQTPVRFSAVKNSVEISYIKFPSFCTLPDLVTRELCESAVIGR